MKRVALVLVAALVALVATSSQAVDLNYKFFSQKGNEPVDVAADVHFSLINADGAKVFDNGTAGPVDEGSYILVAEQASTGFAGSVSIDVVEDQDEATLFLLSEEGVQELEGVHECDGKGVCECDANCICRVFNHNCTKRVCKCEADNVAPAEVAGSVDPNANCGVAPATCCAETSACCCTPPTAPYGCSMMGTLGTLGAIAAVIAVAVADDDEWWGGWDHRHRWYPRPASNVLEPTDYDYEYEYSYYSGYRHIPRTSYRYEYREFDLLDGRR